MSVSDPGYVFDFDTPTAVPRDAEQAGAWQDANRRWWERHPMRYDWATPILAEELSTDFFREIDERFFCAAREYLPWAQLPFDSLIDFQALRSKDVLEIGVGSGSHAQLLARHARSFTGIDITGCAVASTSKRFQEFGLRGTILQMDAERMEFPAESFDFVWSWGVIHHSAHTENVLRQMHRVMRPGARAVTMVYHRGFWNYYFLEGARGVITGQLFRAGSLHRVAQSNTDGALARFYSKRQWRELTSRYLEIENIGVVGQRTESCRCPRASLGRLWPERFPIDWAAS